MSGLLRFILGSAEAMLIMASAPGTSATARTCTATSGPQRVAVLEIYTSEGCDSCPPAERWASGLPSRNIDASRLIPLAFHVDYWDHIGWKDPFAQARFSDRQRQRAKSRGASFVFTPQLLLNGRDYRRGVLLDDIGDRVNAINRSKPLADIKLTLTHTGSTLDSAVEAVAKSNEQGAQLYLALVENHLVIAVNAGENKGRTLKHDFVVRELVGPLPLDASGRLRYDYAFQLASGWKVHDLALVAFVQHAQSGDVWQALNAACL